MSVALFCLKVKQFAVQIVNEIDKLEGLQVGAEVRIAAYAYSNKIVPIVNFTQNANAETAIANILANEPIYSETYMYEAIETAKQAFQNAEVTRPEAQQILIIFSDGKPFRSTGRGSPPTNENVEAVIANLQGVMRDDVKVYMIGVNRTEERILAAVANATNGFAVRANNFGTLNQYPEEVIRDLEIQSCQSNDPDRECTKKSCYKVTLYVCNGEFCGILRLYFQLSTAELMSSFSSTPAVALATALSLTL